MPRPYDIRERTFVFACEVVRFTLKLAERSDLRRIAFQLMDSATSTAANVEEAKAAYSRREFAMKNCIALKEAREARLWLRILKACSLAHTAVVDPLYEEAGEIVGILTQTVKSSRAARKEKV